VLTENMSARTLFNEPCAQGRETRVNRSVTRRMARMRQATPSDADTFRNARRTLVLGYASADRGVASRAAVPSHAGCLQSHSTSVTSLLPASSQSALQYLPHGPSPVTLQVQCSCAHFLVLAIAPPDRPCAFKTVTTDVSDFPERFRSRRPERHRTRREFFVSGVQRRSPDGIG
jgi:hypothetical protein